MTRYKINLNTGLILFSGFLLLLFQGCAKVGSPTGGPRDVNPPKYIEGEPENRATNFTGKEIIITFDEYIQLKDQNKEIIISPPLKEKPVIRVRDKDIRITLNNELSPQTTYTVNFGKAISDLNESNPLPDFEFVISTGETIDSLSVTGKVINAFNLIPDSKKGFVVMLYENLSDSAPLVEIPKYYGSVNENGLFSVNNIRPDTFRIIALKDENSNLIYDQGLESIAFLDSLLIISAGNVKSQTFIKDTVRIITPGIKPGRGNKQGADRIEADTVVAPGKQLNALSISMRYFMELPDKIFLTSRKREQRENLTFIFSRPPYDTVRIAPINFTPSDDWFVKETSRNSDTLTYWITDTLVSRQDTLKFKLIYLAIDSLGQYAERIDTVNMRFQQTTAKGASSGRKPRGDPKVVVKQSLPLSSSITNRGVLNINQSIVMAAAKPLQKVDSANIELYKLVDSLSIKQPFFCLKDSFSVRKFRIQSNWEEDSKYRLLLKPGAATDLTGLANDSAEIIFSTQKADYYSRILLTISAGQYPMIVQVLDPKERVVASRLIKQPGVSVFDYLSPGNYSLKAIYDQNGNGIWDTGNYLNHIQPEHVFLHKMTDQLRSGWDHEVNWIISD